MMYKSASRAMQSFAKRGLGGPGKWTPSGKPNKGSGKGKGWGLKTKKKKAKALPPLTPKPRPDPKRLLNASKPVVLPSTTAVPVEVIKDGRRRRRRKVSQSL